MSSFGCANPTNCPYGGRCDYGCSLITVSSLKISSTPKPTVSSPKFQKGDRVTLVNNFTDEVKKYGQISRLRNDDWEEKNNHSRGVYHYIVYYEDGSYETYENERNLRSHKDQKPTVSSPKFQKGDRVDLINDFTNEVKKSGQICCLRNDEYEKRNNHPNGVYYYSVDYDDGSFKTYVNERNLRSHK